MVLMKTVLNLGKLRQTPVLCGLMSVLTATALGCGAAVGSVLLVETVWSDPSAAAEPTVLVALLAASAVREKSVQAHSRGEVEG